MTLDSEKICPATEFLQSQIEPLRLNQITHYTVCERYTRRQAALGTLLVITSTLSLGFSFFSPPANLPFLSYIPPAVSVIVAVLAALIAFVNDNARAVDHQSSAVAYGALLRECESRTCGAYTEQSNADFLPEFESRWHSISSTSPLTRLVDREKVTAGN